MDHVTHEIEIINSISLLVSPTAKPLSPDPKEEREEAYIKDNGCTCCSFNICLSRVITL